MNMEKLATIRHMPADKEEKKTALIIYWLVSVVLQSTFSIANKGGDS
jgi:hypothetical protein